MVMVGTELTWKFKDQYWINIDANLENGGKKVSVDAMRDTWINGIALRSFSLSEKYIINKGEFGETIV